MAQVKLLRLLFPHLLIQASAGTGKTFQLSNRYVGLLHADVRADSILASTFTRKAASEILERVIVRLARAAVEEKQRAELARFLGRSELTRARCLELTQRLTRQLHRVRISTFDSFFGQIARSFSLELGLPPGWKIVDQFEDKALRDEAIARVLDEDNAHDLSTLLNLMTKGESTRGVNEVLRSTVDELYELFQETDEAAWLSIPNPLPLPAAKFSEVFKALAEFEFPNNRMANARDRDLTLIEQEAWDLLIDSGMANKILNDAPEYYSRPIPAEAVALYRQLLAHAKSELVGRVARQTKATYDMLLRFDKKYRELKRQNSAVRFDDVTRGVARLAQPSGTTASDGHERWDTRATADQLAFRLDSRVQHLLLDEFQDTSPTQWRAIRSLALRSVDPTRNGTFFCVGDVKQAIYGWRGGVAEIFDAIENEIGDVERQPLNQSFRSSQIIIDTVNRVFQGMTRHSNLEQYEHVVRTWAKERFTEHSTAKSELPGYACLWTAPADNDDSDDSALLEFTAQHVAKIVRDVPAASVGVLVRKNETVGRLIHALRRNNVHASEEGGNPLTDSAAVHLILSLLRLADHPGDTVVRFHVTHSPLAKALHCESLDDAGAAGLAQKIRRELLDLGYGPLLYEWMKWLAPHCNSRELNRLTQLVELGYGYQPRATLRSDHFIDFVEQQKVADQSAANVRVMTVHQSKGLEFDVVVLPELDGNLLGQPETFVVYRKTPTSPVSRVCRYANQSVVQLMPDDLQKTFEEANERKVSEGLCVLYVAITRAIHALHMIVKPSSDREKKLPRTYAALLRAALVGEDPIAPQTKAFELGNPQWFQSLPAKTKLPAPTRAAAKADAQVPPTVVLAPISDRRRRGLDRVAPSGLEGGERVRLADVFASGNAVAMARGTLVHAWFESIGWLEDGIPSDAELRRIGAEKVTDLSIYSLDLDEQIHKFRAMLDQPQVAAALSRKTYAAPATIGFDEPAQAAAASPYYQTKIRREYNFAVRTLDQLVTGSIDRLVLLYSGDTLIAADLLDFKTDALPAHDPATLDNKINFYRPQLHAYREALRSMTGLPLARILTRLVFVANGEVRVV